MISTIRNTAMKRFVVLCIIMIVLGLCCTSCRNFMSSHNFNTVADGKVFRFGTPEFNLLFVRGTVTTTIGRENIETVVETNNGDSVSNPAGSFRGLTTAKFRVGPQITGYLKDIAETDPATAKAYINAMPKLNKAMWDVKQSEPVDAPSIQEMAERAQELIDPFVCNGDCDLQDLWKNNAITYQQAVATKLLSYTDEKSGWEGDTVTFRQSLRMFLVRMAQLTAKGKTTTCMRVKYAIVKSNQITDLNYVMIEPDGNQFDTHCPECVLLEE